MLTATLVPLLLLQVGPNPDPNAIGNMIPRDPREESMLPRRLVRSVSETAKCELGAGIDAAEVAEIASARAQLVTGNERIAALQCAAMAKADQGLWDEAASGFLEARNAAGGNLLWQARIGTQRAHALVEAGRVIDARSAFEIAIRDALSGGDTVTAGQIAADQAIAEVAAGDLEAAGQTLAEARSQSPGEYRVWLLSATLARREGDLATAQGHIEKAAELDGIDPEIGLEAGVIAALDGRLDAARASFESVAAQPHAGETGDKARAYLAQLDSMLAESE